ncbi:hypothetical protein HDU99_008313, partial [Rhizoclosmatium hyalinum]
AEAKAQTRLAQLRRQTQTTRAAHEEAQRLLAALQRHPTSNPVEDEKAAELRQNAAVLNAKGNEYSDRISALEKDAVVPSDGRDLDSLAVLQADIDKGLSVLKLKKDTLDAVQHLPPVIPGYGASPDKTRRKKDATGFLDSKTRQDSTIHNVIINSQLLFEMAVCGLQPHPYHALIAFFLKVFAITVGYMPMQQMILIIVCSDVMPEVSVSSIHMPDYAICAANATVSATAASWSLSQQLFESVPSLFVICIAGYFLDKYGRTSAMILSALSVLFTAVTTLTVAVIVEYGIEGYSASALLYALLTAAGFSGIAGGLVLFRTACSAYLSDTTLPATRTRYFLLLDAAMSVAITGGPLIGGSLANTL